MIEIGKAYFDGEAHRRLMLTTREDLMKFGYVIIRYRKAKVTSRRNDMPSSGIIRNYERKGRIVGVNKEDATYSVSESIRLEFKETVESNGINRVIDLNFTNDSNFEIIFYEFQGQYTFLKLQGKDVTE